VVNGPGIINRTTDGGASWELQVDTPSYLRSAGFVDTLRGFVGSLDGPPLLYSTTDGGEQWTPIFDVPPPQPTGICGIWVVNEQVAYACGKYDGTSARVIKTTDGGASWTSMDLAPLATRLVDCFFFDADRGFVVGGIGAGDARRAVVLATTDGGATWTTRYTTNQMPEWCWKISFPTPTVGYISIERFSGATNFLKTTDGGETWQEIFFRNNYIVQGIGFATPDLGWIGGPTGPTYETTDGGASWHLAGFGVHINRFRFLGPSIGYAAGSTVYKYTTTIGVPASSGLPVLTLTWSHPNPFARSTTLGYSLARASNVRITIIDAQGRRIATLLDAPQPEGTHEVQWNARDGRGEAVGAGVYWYRLEAAGSAQAQKMLLVR
jgi:photosystem II stability/assembly factor-like uncharacterized protein